MNIKSCMELNKSIPEAKFNFQGSCPLIPTRDSHLYMWTAHMELVGDSYSEEHRM